MKLTRRGLFGAFAGGLALEALTRVPARAGDNRVVGAIRFPDGEEVTFDVLELHAPTLGDPRRELRLTIDNPKFFCAGRT